MIYTQRQVERLHSKNKIGIWKKSAFDEFIAKVADPAFPCTFGTVALNKKEILFSFIDETDRKKIILKLVICLSEFSQMLREMSVVEASTRPFAIFMKPPKKCTNLRDYYHYSWALLEEVHMKDPKPWPDRIPRDTENPKWSFCFGGIPFFLNFKTPMHLNRKSRRMSESYLWLVQARDGFDILAGDHAAGHRARKIIRQKLAAYDDMPIYPAFTHYGANGNREWLQYFVPDTNEYPGGKCPFFS